MTQSIAALLQAFLLGFAIYICCLEAVEAQSGSTMLSGDVSQGDCFSVERSYTRSTISSSWPEYEGCESTQMFLWYQNGKVHEIDEDYNSLGDWYLEVFVHAIAPCAAAPAGECGVDINGPGADACNSCTYNGDGTVTMDCSNFFGMDIVYRSDFAPPQGSAFSPPQGQTVSIVPPEETIPYDLQFFKLPYDEAKCRHPDLHALPPQATDDPCDLVTVKLPTTPGSLRGSGNLFLEIHSHAYSFYTRVNQVVIDIGTDRVELDSYQGYKVNNEVAHTKSARHVASNYGFKRYENAIAIQNDNCSAAAPCQNQRMEQVGRGEFRVVIDACG